MKQISGQFCPICDIWVDISSDHPVDGGWIHCPNNHRLWCEWAEGDFEDFHLHQKQWTDKVMNELKKRKR